MCVCKDASDFRVGRRGHHGCVFEDGGAPFLRDGAGLRQVASEEGSGVSSGFRAAAASPRASALQVFGGMLELYRGGAELGRCWVRQDLVCWCWAVARHVGALAVVELIRSLWSGSRPTGKGYLPFVTSFYILHCFPLALSDLSLPLNLRVSEEMGAPSNG